MKQARKLLSSEEIQSIRAPIESARTFPRRAFTSQEFFDAEMVSVFGRNWAGACLAGQLSSVGDVIVLQEFGVPLLAVHGQDGQIRIFHNVCPYDGCLVAMESRSWAEHLRVAYHGWLYSLNGELLEAPYWGGHPKSGVEGIAEEHRWLVEVPSGIALGIVFVDLSGAAGPFDDYIQPLYQTLDAYDFDAIEGMVGESGSVDMFVDSAATNWKTLAENDCLNILHESFTHAMYAASPDIPRVSEDGVARFEVVDTGNVLGFSYLESDVPSTYSEIELPHIGRDAVPDRGFFLQLYPNVSMAVMSTLIAPTIQLPGGPGETVIAGTMLIRAGGSNSASTSAGILDAVGAGFAMAAQEDGAVIEAIQAGRQSPAYEQNFYAPFWDQPHYRFTNRILDDLLVE